MTDEDGASMQGEDHTKELLVITTDNSILHQSINMTLI